MQHYHDVDLLFFTGSEDYFYYTAVDALNKGDLSAADKIIKSWQSAPGLGQNARYSKYNPTYSSNLINPTLHT